MVIANTPQGHMWIKKQYAQLAAHSPGYLLGFGLDKNWYIEEIVRTFFLLEQRQLSITLQQVNDSDSGYDQGWNKYCHIGLARHLDILRLMVLESPVQKT